MTKLGVNTIVLDKSKQKVLLVKRRDIPIWVLPGGGVEKGETIENAAKRETQEETGLKIRSVRLAGIFSKYKKSSNKVFVYIGQIASGEKRVGNESSKILFWKITNLPLTFPWYQQERILRVLSGKNRKIVLRSTQNISISSLISQYIQFPYLFPSFFFFVLKKKWKF